MIEAILSKGREIPWSNVEARLGKEELKPEEFAAAILDESDERLELLARAARKIRTQRFGNAIKIYAPLYLSNSCINTCQYCGFNKNNAIPRTTLSNSEALAECEMLIRGGHRHILLVSGEDDESVSLEYLQNIARSIRPRVASLAIEVRPMNLDEYRTLAQAGVDGVTLYQETYQRDVYSVFHKDGPKADFDKRLECIEAAGMAGMRFLGIGALLGLADWRRDAVALLIHARHLQQRFWRSNITISLPRLHTVPPGLIIPQPVCDRDLVRMMTALRCALHDVGIIMSTRENAELRNGCVPLGITQMSAGSCTEPGGYSAPHHAGEQFSVEDIRTPDEVARSLSESGFDPVFKDWESNLYGG